MIKIEHLFSTQEESVLSLLASYGFKPYGQYVREFGPSAIRDYFIHGARGKLRSKDTRALWAREGEKALGLVAWSPSRLESEQFGFSAACIDYLIAVGDYALQRKVKRALLLKCQEECLSSRIQYSSLRVDARDLSGIHALENNGFILVDGLISYGRDLRRGTWSSPAEAGFQIRPAVVSDLPELRGLAGSAYSFDRLHADPAIPKLSADKIHVVWLENSINSSDDQVLVAVDESGPLGYSVFKINHSTTQFFGEPLGIWVIAATTERARDKGVARSLCLAMFDWYRDQGIRLVEGGTQLANVASARLHESCGYRVVSTSVSMSKWFGVQE